MTRAYFDGNWHAYVDYEVSTVRQNAANNTTTARVSVWVGIDRGSSIKFNNTQGAYIGISIGGKNEYLYFNTLYVDGSRQSIGSVDITFEHNSDGTGVRNVTLWSGSTSNITYGSLYIGSLNTSSSVTFTAIGRKNIITECPSVVDVYTPFTVKSQNYYSGFYVYWDIKYNYGGQYKWLTATEGNNVTITTIRDNAATLMRQFYDWSKITVTVDCVTKTSKNGETVGVSSQDVTVTFSRNNPTLASISLTDRNATVRSVLGSSTSFLKTLSTIQVTFNGASGAYGSSIVGYHAEIVGLDTQTNVNGGEFGLLKKSGSFNVQAYVTDNRGLRSNVITVPINIIDYSPPTLSLDAIRASGKNDIIQIRRNATISPITIGRRQKNRFRLRFMTRPANGRNEAWVANSGAGIDSMYTSELINSSANLNGTFDPSQSFEVQGILEDSFTSTAFVTLVSVEEVVLSYAPTGIGVGKIWERGSLDVKDWAYFGKGVSVKGATYLDGDVRLNNKTIEDVVKSVMLSMYPVGSIYMSTENRNPALFIGGKWERYAYGRTLVGVQEWDNDFSRPGAMGGSKDLPLPQVGGTGIGNTNLYLANYKLEEYTNPRGWDVHSGNEMKPAIAATTGYNKLQPYVAVYIWRRTE